MTDRNLSTRVVHAGEQRIKPHHAITTPVVQTSTYTFENTKDLIDYMEAKLWGDESEREEYGRYGNPTVATAESMYCSAHVMSSQGTVALINPSVSNWPQTRTLRGSPARARTRNGRSISNANTRRMATTVTGPVSCTAILIQRNEAPQIRVSEMNAVHCLNVIGDPL